MVQACHNAGVKVIAGTLKFRLILRRGVLKLEIQTLFSTTWAAGLALVLLAPLTPTTTILVSIRIQISITAGLNRMMPSWITPTPSKFKLASFQILQSTFHPCRTHHITNRNFLGSLKTESEHVRGRLAQYANDLFSLDVDGLRLDAAKRT